MLTIFLTLAFVLGIPAAQTQGNPGAQPPSDPSQMSLAERAAAARKASAARANRGESSRPDGPPALTPEQRGTVQSNAYINNVLHFRIALTEWKPLSEERVAPARAIETTASVEASICGNSSAVERQPSKLGVAGSNPVSRSTRSSSPFRREGMKVDGLGPCSSVGRARPW